MKYETKIIHTDKNGNNININDKQVKENIKNKIYDVINSTLRR